MKIHDDRLLFIGSILPRYSSSSFSLNLLFPGGVLAHAFAPRDGRVHMDNDERWVFHDTNGAELEVVLTHELGHALGLSHSTVRGSIMAPFYIPYRENFELHIDDIAGMQYLYGK